MRKTNNQVHAEVLRLRAEGINHTAIAGELDLTTSQVSVILKNDARRRSRLAGLVKRYGEHPEIEDRHDMTSIEVLALCDGKMEGWGGRVRNLRNAGIYRLGDLRRARNSELLKIPSLGRKLLQEIRRFCPYEKDPKTRRRKVGRVRRANPKAG